VGSGGVYRQLGTLVNESGLGGGHGGPGGLGIWRGHQKKRGKEGWCVSRLRDGGGASFKVTGPG